MKDIIRDIISETCLVDKNLIKDDTILIEDLGIDSITVLEVIIELEKEFKIDFNFDEVIINYNITLNTLEKVIKEIMSDE